MTESRRHRSETHEIRARDGGRTLWLGLHDGQGEVQAPKQPNCPDKAKQAAGEREDPLERNNRILNEPRGAQTLYRIGLGWSNGDRVLFSSPSFCHTPVEKEAQQRIYP